MGAIEPGNNERNGDRPTNAIVPNASVTAVETGTNTTYKASTSQQGFYQFSQAIVGAYKVTAQAPGFQPQEKTGVAVQINSTTSLNFSLALGSASTTVTVSAAF